MVKVFFLTRNCFFIVTVYYAVVELQICLCAEAYPDCEPAEEGKPFVLTRETRIDAEFRDIQWVEIDKRGNRDNVSLCYSDKPYCYDFTDNYTPSRKQEEAGKYVNKLVISEVGPDNRESILRIENWDRITGWTREAYSCKMRTYSKPVDPRCEVRLVGDNKVMVNCTTDHSYPPPSCRIKQFNEDTGETELFAEGTQITYSPEKVIEDGNTYWKTICSTTAIHSLSSGSYSFFAIMELVGTEVSVKSKPSAALDFHNGIRLLGPDQTTEECSDPVDFTCQADDFDTQPEFKWSFNDRQVNLNCSPVAPGDGPRKYTQKCSVSKASLLEEDSIKCKATPKPDVHDSLNLRHLRKNFRPKLSIEDTIFEHGAKASAHQESRLVGLFMPRKLPDRIVCTQDEEELVRMSSINATRVSFRLDRAKEGKVFCTCSALMATTCLDLHATVEIDVRVQQNEDQKLGHDVRVQQNEDQKLGLEATIFTGVLISLATVAMVFLIILIFIRKRSCRRIKEDPEYESISSGRLYRI